MYCHEEEGKIERSFVPISRNNEDAHTVSRRRFEGETGRGWELGIESSWRKFYWEKKPIFNAREQWKGIWKGRKIFLIPKFRLFLTTFLSSNPRHHIFQKNPTIVICTRAIEYFQCWIYSELFVIYVNVFPIWVVSVCCKFLPIEYSVSLNICSNPYDNLKLL